MEECIFCKIINKELPAEIVFEDEQFIVIKDINPKAETHLLLIPKKHIESVADLKKEDNLLMGDLIILAKEIASQKGLEGYKLVFNVGKAAGQMVEHIHLHLLSGKISILP